MFSTFKKLTFLIDKKLKKKLILIYFITVIGTFLETLGIGVVLPILKVIVEGKDFLNEFYFNNEFLNNILKYMQKKSYGELVVFLLASLSFIFFIKTLFFLFLIQKQQKFSHLVEYELTKSLFSHYLNQDYSFHLKRNSSELLSNITEEIRNVRVSLIDPFLIISTEIIFLLAIISFLVVIEPVGSLAIGIITLMISLIYVKITSKKILNLSEKRLVHEALKIQHLRQGLNGIKEIKISSKENSFLSIFDKHNRETLYTRTKFHTWMAFPRYILEFIGVFCLSTLAIIMVKKGADIKSLLPTLGVFVVATLRLLPSASKMIQAAGKIRYGVPSVNLLKKEISQASFKNVNTNNIKKLKFDELKFEDISFQYPESNKKILDKISLKIKKGDKIGIIGASGSGKSTLIDIFTGLTSPSDGKIYLNDRLVELNDKNWYDMIGYTPQFIFLTDDTILNNIAFGVTEENLKLKSIENACKAAELKNYIEKLSLGLKTSIGELGVRLSGGQRQRIGIARAIYRNPQILVFDESTSAIDVKTEEKIINNINLFTDKTVIIISHRLSTLRKCNKIFEIKDGNLLTKII